MIAWLRTHWRWLLPVATFAAGWFAHRPQSAVHQVATASSVVAQTARTETHSEEGAWSVKTWEYAPQAPAGGGSPGPVADARPSLALPTTSSVAPAAPVTGPLLRYTEETHAPSASTTSSDSQAIAQQQSSLDLTITPQPRPGWAVGVGVDGLPGTTIRLSARRRLLGPFWAEISAVPATRSVGLGVAVEW